MEAATVHRVRLTEIGMTTSKMEDAARSAAILRIQMSNSVRDAGRCCGETRHKS